MKKEQMKEIMREEMQVADDKIYDDVIAKMESCFGKLKKSDINIPLIKEIGDMSFEETVDKIIEKWANNENTDHAVKQLLVKKFVALPQHYSYVYALFSSREQSSEYTKPKKNYHEIIMGYFNTEHIDRVDLEKLLDFENLTMTEQIETDIKKQLVDAGYSKEEAQKFIREFIRFVKNRSESGEITWEDFINKLKDLEDWFAESDFGIRVQRFSKETYWEVFFNHFDIETYEKGKSRLTFNHIYYFKAENEKARETLDDYGVYGDVPMEKMLSVIAKKWTELSDENKDAVISAIATITTTTQYVDRSRMVITNESIERITMSNADLVPQMGLRDYTITFTNGEKVCLRF